MTRAVEIKGAIVNYPPEPAEASYAVKFRNEAAKDILCAAINGGIVRGLDGFVKEKDTLVAGAIEVADELIRQLREGNK